MQHFVPGETFCWIKNAVEDEEVKGGKVIKDAEGGFECKIGFEEVQKIEKENVRLGLSNLMTTESANQSIYLNQIWTTREAIEVVDNWFLAQE